MATTELVAQSRDTQLQQSGSMQDVILTALQQGAPAETLKELAALYKDLQRFEWEREERQSRIDFDNALSNCQQQIGRVAPNVKRNDTNSWWADYAQLDRTLRPIYTAAQFSISFSEVEPIHEGKVRIRATVARAGISKEYFSEITPTTTGPKGGAMATPTDADAIALSRAKRYLLLDIFNVAVGIDKIEKQGIPEGGDGLDEKTFATLKEKIDGARSLKELEAAWFAAAEAAQKVGDRRALSTFEQAKRECWRQNGGFK